MVGVRECDLKLPVNIGNRKESGRTAVLQNLAEFDAAAISRSVLECGCPLPLSRAIAVADRHFQIALGVQSARRSGIFFRFLADLYHFDPATIFPMLEPDVEQAWIVSFHELKTPVAILLQPAVQVI